MKKNNISTKPLSGFMELLPSDQVLFDRIKEVIIKNYEKFGFMAMDTPLIEKEEVLLTKAGGETEKQIYRFKKGDNDLALRFDLTISLARYVVENFNNLNFPFRRYVIGKVYRGERPQKGRFREFYQCDVDVIGDGNLSLKNDAEIPSVIYNIFKELDFGDFVIKINNRKILNGFFSSLDLEDRSSEIMIVVDKLDKIGIEGVKDELVNLSLKEESIEKILEFINISGTNEGKIEELESLDIDNEVFKEGVRELKEVFELALLMGIESKNLEIDLSIARGLDYYTGTVYETFIKGYEKIGSVCSGGRYDNLASQYTDKKLPGVGISIGLTRLFDQLKDNGLLKDYSKSKTEVLIVSLLEDFKEAFGLANKLRGEDVNTQVYLDEAKPKKIFGYADKNNIPYVVVIGEDEIKGGYYTFKDMKKGEQKQLKLEDILEAL